MVDMSASCSPSQGTGNGIWSYTTQFERYIQQKAVLSVSLLEKKVMEQHFTEEMLIYTH